MSEREQLVLLDRKNLVNHFRVVTDLTDPERAVRASVSESKYGAIMVKVMPMREWNYLAELSEDERDKLLWFPLMHRLRYWMQAIRGTLQYGASHGWTEAVFHGGHLDGVHERVGTDAEGFPSTEMKAPVPPTIEHLHLTLDKSEVRELPWDDFTREVRYRRERLPREDGLWHYNKE